MIILTTIYSYLELFLQLCDHLGKIKADFEEDLKSIQGIKKNFPGITIKKSCWLEYENFMSAKISKIALIIITNMSKPRCNLLLSKQKHSWEKCSNNNFFSSNYGAYTFNALKISIE